MQISTAPTDNRLLGNTIPHQIKVFEEQVSEILITGDIRPGKGRFQFDDNAIQKFRNILDSFKDLSPKVKVLFVDYDPKTRKEIAADLWGLSDLPIKDYRGGPFYSYLYGIGMASGSHILHLDSDILLGGEAGSWSSEAMELYESDPRIATILPYSGPPFLDDKIPDHYRLRAKPYRDISNTYMSNSFTTRVFFVSKKRIRLILNQVQLKKPDMLRSMLGLWYQNPLVMAPEQLISSFLENGDYFRVDYPGSGVPFWTLHPPFRSEEFYNRLEGIIEAVENNEIPPEQRGYHDLNKGFINWEEAIANLPFYRQRKARKRFM